MDHSGPLPDQAFSGTEKMIIISAVENVLAVAETSVTLHGRSACTGWSREQVFMVVFKSQQKKEELERKESLLLSSLEGLSQLKSSQAALKNLGKFFVEEMVPHCSGGSGQRMSRGVASSLRQHLQDHPKSSMPVGDSEDLILSVFEHTAEHYIKHD